MTVDGTLEYRSTRLNVDLHTVINLVNCLFGLTQSVLTQSGFCVIILIVDVVMNLGTFQIESFAIPPKRR